MTVKEHLQQVVADMTEEEAADVLALVAGAKAGATPVDVYGTAWGSVLTDGSANGTAAGFAGSAGVVDSAGSVAEGAL